MPGKEKVRYQHTHSDVAVMLLTRSPLTLRGNASLAPQINGLGNSRAFFQSKSDNCRLSQRRTLGKEGTCLQEFLGRFRDLFNIYGLPPTIPAKPFALGYPP